jgi:hypothetical protein
MKTEHCLIGAKKNLQKQMLLEVKICSCFVCYRIKEENESLLAEFVTLN